MPVRASEAIRIRRRFSFDGMFDQWESNKSSTREKTDRDAQRDDGDARKREREKFAAMKRKRKRWRRKKTWRNGYR